MHGNTMPSSAVRILAATILAATAVENPQPAGAQDEEDAQAKPPTYEGGVVVL